MEQGAFYSKEYRNVFKELGYSQEEIDARVEQTFQICSRQRGGGHISSRKE